MGRSRHRLGAENTLMAMNEPEQQATTLCSIRLARIRVLSAKFDPDEAMSVSLRPHEQVLRVDAEDGRMWVYLVQYLEED